jgi:hypothetical protein
MKIKRKEDQEVELVFSVEMMQKQGKELSLVGCFLVGVEDPCDVTGGAGGKTE